MQECAANALLCCVVGHFEGRGRATSAPTRLLPSYIGERHPNPNRRLTLPVDPEVQNTPTQSNDRYANGLSSGKGRYTGCRAGFLSGQPLASGVLTSGRGPCLGDQFDFCQERA
jgi:hypothetical protein